MVGKQAAIKTVKRFAEDVKKQGVQLRKVILFGSYALDRQQKCSDFTSGEGLANWFKNYRSLLNFKFII